MGIASLPNLLLFTAVLLVQSVTPEKLRTRHDATIPTWPVTANHDVTLEQEQTQLHRLAQELGVSMPHEEDINFTTVDPQSIRGGFVLSKRPWFVYFGNEDCGGALVYADIVVTAGHCVDGGFPSTVFVGPTTINRGTLTTDGTTVSVSRGVLHPNYNFPAYDIAVMKLATPVSEAVAILNSDGTVPAAGATGLMVMGMGYESQSSGAKFGTQLKGALGNYISNCASVDSSYNAEADICVTETASVGACQGDSGSPLVLNTDSNLVVGLVSYGDLPCEGNTYGGYTRVSTYYAWVQQQICALASCPPNTCPCQCFSGDTTVQVEPKNTSQATTLSQVAMRDLKVGDRIFTGQHTIKGQPTFQTVYAFGHHHHNRTGDFLQIFTSHDNGTAPLEITSNHLLYVERLNDFVPAAKVEVGDSLVVNGIATQVTKIRRVKKEGVYMPLTEHGTILVNGVLVSSYTSIAENAPTVVQRAIQTLGSEHLLSHLWMAPYRFMCLGISPRLCQEGSFNEEGILRYLNAGKHLAEWAEPLGHFIHIWILMPPLLSLFASLHLMEKLVSPSLAPTAFMILGIILCRVLVRRKQTKHLDCVVAAKRQQEKKAQ